MCPIARVQRAPKTALNDTAYMLPRLVFVCEDKALRVVSLKQKRPVFAPASKREGMPMAVQKPTTPAQRKAAALKANLRRRKTADHKEAADARKEPPKHRENANSGS